MAGFEHGRHDCSICLRPGSQLTTPDGQWQLTHWPAYWGSAAPHTLVLGFSMGARQIKAIGNKPFDQVGFDKLRANIARILDTLALDRGGQSMDELLSLRSRGFGFSSLARCSLGHWENGAFKTSGRIMSLAVEDPWASTVLKQCTSRYLVDMPASVHRVVLLGNSDAYVKGIRRLINQAFGDYSAINDMAFRAGGRTWIFTVHPAAQGNRVAEWIEEPASTSSGRKREAAMHAVRLSQTQAAPQAPSTIGKRTIYKVSRTA